MPMRSVPPRFGAAAAAGCVAGTLVAGGAAPVVGAAGTAVATVAGAGPVVATGAAGEIGAHAVATPTAAPTLMMRKNSRRCIP